MRDAFAGYYAPTDEEYTRLWNEATIVLDTNTLLDLYRFPATARDELLAALELVKDRLWIPHQVGLEFQRQRSTVIAGERASSEGALKAIETMIHEVRQRVESLQIEERGLGLQVEPLFADLHKFGESITEAVTRVRDAQPNIAHQEPIRDRLDQLFSGRVGTPPLTQQELDTLTDQGDDRFDRKIPPGYEDADKEKNPSLATFNYDGLRYQRKFGDLILWRQVIAHARQNNIKVVMFITSEQKEDWWWKEKGKTLGPRPELIREIRREGQAELFWMYAPDQFLQQSQRYTAAQVTKKAVDEITQALMASSQSSNWPESLGVSGTSSNFWSRPGVSTRVAEQVAVRAVADWLEGSGREVEIVKGGFPDIIVQDNAGQIGFEIKTQRNFHNLLFSPGIVNAILRGYHATNEGSLDRFALVVLIDDEAYRKIVDEDRLSDLAVRVDRLLRRYDIDAIIIGSIVDERFELITDRHRLGDEIRSSMI